MNEDVEDPPESILDVFLQPGEFYWGKDNTRIRTLLGSCVAIVIWHPQNHTGGMCHYMLPGAGRHPRYADGAMAAFLSEIRISGSHSREYHARIFGGGNMFEEREKRSYPRHIGQANIEAAYSLLKNADIRILSASTGGAGYRKLIFELWNGHVWMKRQEPALSGGKR